MGDQAKRLLSIYGKRLFDLFVLIAAVSTIVAIFVPSPSTARVVILVISFLSISVAFVINRLIMSKVHVEYHRIDSIQSCDNANFAPVEMIGRNLAVITSGDEHVKVKIVGKVYGPELNALAKKFNLPNFARNAMKADSKKTLKTLKVYAVISEKRRREPESKFVWVQANEGDLLRDNGTYAIYAYLGGRGVDTAQHGDVFTLRVFITAKGPHEFKPFPLPSIGELSDAIYLSDEYFVVVERPRLRQRQ